LVEHLALNERVQGSSPWRLTYYWFRVLRLSRTGGSQRFFK